MIPTLPGTTVRRPATAWAAVPALLLVTLALVGAACGGGEPEVFDAEPAGFIAFTSGRDGNMEIYRMNGDGSEQLNISNNETGDTEPWWSSDGTLLAFSSLRTGTPNIFAMTADGGDVRQLTDTPAVEAGARWSPDSSHIAFYSFREQSSGFLWLMNADGSDPRPLLQSLTPAFPDTPCGGGFPGGWSPDGERIIFRGGQGDINALQICSISADGSDPKVILSEFGVKNYFPSVSPDGSKIAFTSDRDGNPEIYTMNDGGGDLRRLTDSPTFDEYPTWSPDGQWIAFHSDRDGDDEIFIIRPDGSDLRQLTENDTTDREPSWARR